MESPKPVRPTALLALAAVCVLGFVIAYIVFVQTEFGARGDEAAFAGRGAATVRGTEFAQNLLTSISAGTLLIAFAVIVVQALVRGRRTLAVVAATVLVGSVLSAEVLKHFLLERPDLVFSPIDQNSFPSGHTTVAFSIGVAATIVAPEALRDRVAFVAIAYGGAVGVATVAAGWHRPSDVLAAYLVTIAWASLTVAAALTLDRRDFRRSPFSAPDASMWTRWLGIGGAMLVGAYIVAIAVVLAGAVGITDWSRVHGAFIAGCASLVAAAAVLMVAFLAALGRSAGVATTAAAESSGPPSRSRPGP